MDSVRASWTRRPSVGPRPQALKIARHPPHRCISPYLPVSVPCRGHRIIRDRVLNICSDPALPEARADWQGKRDPCWQGSPFILTTAQHGIAQSSIAQSSPAQLMARQGPKTGDFDRQYRHGSWLGDLVRCAAVDYACRHGQAARNRIVPPDQSLS